MQTQGMNYGNQRGFGGPPQPQRQGGRRGNANKGFRQNRFDSGNQRNQNQGGQRPVSEVKPVQPAPSPQQTSNHNKQTPQQQQKSEALPSPQAQSTQQTPKAAASSNIPPKSESQENLDKSGSIEQKPAAGNYQNQQQKNFNGNIGGNAGSNTGMGSNRQSGTWSQGQPSGNKQAGNFGGANKQHGGNQGAAPRNQQRGNMRGQQQEEHMLANKLKDLTGPLHDLPPIDQTEVKFSGRSRLYIGNLTSDATEDEINKLFSQFGETSELFLNKEKNFGFIKMDFRVNAEKARRELDGKNRNGRTLKVRFAPHNSAVRVKNLPPFVSNELLYRAFEIFGKIERAYVKVDDRGKPLGEGVVEYVRKPSALAACRNCTEKCFFLTASLRPVIVEPLDEPDEADGYPEKNIPKKNPDFLRAREIGPRFSETNSFEHEYGTRWKQLHELHRQKEEALKKELAVEEEKLEAQMEYAKYEHETEVLREQLRQREQDRERQKRSWEMAERAAEERRETERALLMRREEDLTQRMRMQDDELRRRQQENTLFVQAQRLSSMLDRQEQGMYDQQQPMEGGYREQYDMARGYDDMQARGWDAPPMDEFPNKRRRF